MIEQPVSDKVCGKCKATKPATEFSRSSRRRSGHHPYCRPCKNGYPTTAILRPGRRHWTDFADDVIRARYPDGGSSACHAMLPDRTPQAIQQRAFKLGVACKVLNQYGTPAIVPASPLPQQDFAPAHRIWQSVRLPVYEAANFGTYRINRGIAA